MILATALLGCLAAVGCDGGGGDSGSASTQPASEPAKGPTNRIDLPEQVRQNLGITFAKVELRRVASTIRVPGKFELLPTARREYRTPVAGRVDLLVKQYDQVQAGTALYRLSSPEWIRLRQQLQDDQAAIGKAMAEVAAAEAAVKEARESVRILQERIGGLAEAGTRNAELETQLAERKATLPRLEAQAGAERAKLQAAQHRFPLSLATAAAMSGLTAEQLSEQVPSSAGDGEKVPRWQMANDIEVKASAAGVVEAFGVTDGGWAESAALVLSVVDTRSLRFRASGLQADLGRIPAGAAANIIPPLSNAKGAAPEPQAGSVHFGLEANPETRTIELLIVMPGKVADWARAGVSAYAEIVTDETSEPGPAIPLAAVVQDGLERVYFRRDPRAPDRVIRIEGDFGVADGKWVAVQSGVKAGDEVVLDGVYELMLTGSGKSTGGGHFHADGTWHPDHEGGDK
jgi:hypothetical protein